MRTYYLFSLENSVIYLGEVHMHKIFICSDIEIDLGRYMPSFLQVAFFENLIQNFS